MKYEYQITPWRRGCGAMFRKRLGNTALVFEYARAASRLFHTAFCRKLRIIALSDKGEIIFDQIVRPWSMVRIPPTRLVVELDLDAEVDEDDLKDLALANLRVDPWTVGSWHPEAGLDRLFFALIGEAVADIRRVYEAINRAKLVPPEILPARFKPWERGQILGSAALILESAGSIEIPENAIHISRQVIEVEKEAGYWEELLAASIAGYPWELPRICLKCDQPAYWRPIFEKHADMPEEVAWRYARPENHVPLCKRCAYRMGWTAKDLRHELGCMVWGLRFESFFAWQAGWGRGTAWDLDQYPLWPEVCGGPTWAAGSGALVHAAPRGPAGVYKRPEHLALLEKYFPRRPVTRPYLTSPRPVPVGLETNLPVQGAPA